MNDNLLQLIIVLPTLHFHDQDCYKLCLDKIVTLNVISHLNCQTCHDVFSNNTLTLNVYIKVWAVIMGRSGSGSVGKGGREANYAPPVDQYRRRIARQDSKKEKLHMKEVKHAQETKDLAPKAVKQIVSYSIIY